MTASPGARAGDGVRLGVIALILVEGGIHLQQYEGILHQVPTINTLFVLNAVGAALLALGLSITGDRLAILLALGVAGMSVVALVSLAIARASVLFDYSEPTVRLAVTLSAFVELAAVLAAAAFVALRIRELRTAASAPKMDFSVPHRA